MTMEECYSRLGGSYEEIMGRLPSLKLIEKFIGKFLEDDSYQTLCDAINTGDRAAAFRAAHTLKGVSANLSFTRLKESAGELTELLRPECDIIPDDAAALMEKVTENYQLTVAAILAYREQQG